MTSPGSPDSRRLVIVGASLAGLRAVETARKIGFAGKITLIGDEPHLPYDRPPLSKAFLDPAREPVLPPFRPIEEFATELDVQLELGTRATALDTTARTVHTDRGEFTYDVLIIATGVKARNLPGDVPGADAHGIHPLRSLSDAAAIREGLDRSRRIVVLGAGFIGSEVASAARARNIGVTIVEQATTPMVRPVGERAGNLFVGMHRAAGVGLRLGSTVTEIVTRDGHVDAVILDDGERLAADLVVLGIGASPSTSWLENSGIALHPVDKGILCGSDLRTSAPDVYAAGDVAHTPHPLFDGDLMRLEHWTNAAEQGAFVAKTALGSGALTAAPTVPYFWSDLYGVRVQFVGTPRSDEVLIAGRDTDRPIVLYRRDTRLVGALTFDRLRDIMKFRRRIAAADSWEEALAFAESLTPTSMQA